MWWDREGYRGRPRWIARGLHAFLAFMFLNATVVFASGWVRGLGLSALIALAILWSRSKAALTRS
jgi:hypothetical protein